MKAAIKIGVSLRDYDDMTPHELNLHIYAHNERMRQQGNEGLTLAYLTALWGRVKKMPNLKKLLEEEPKPTAPQTDDEMLRIVKMMNQCAGGTTT